MITNPARREPASPHPRADQIATLRLRRCVQQHVDAGWRVRRGSFAEWSGYVIELVTALGTPGYGYIDVLIEFSDGWEVHRSALATLAPVLMARNPFEIESILLDLESRLASHRFVKAAIDTALHEIVARSTNQPLCNLFGGPVQRRVEATQIIPVKDPESMARDALGRVRCGFRHIKIKLTGDTAADVARVAAVRNSVGTEVRLSVDANQGYASAKDAIRALRKMESFDIDFAEQPVHESDKKGLRRIRDATAIKIEADESAKSLEDVFDLLSMEAVDSINLRVNELGGFRNALAAVRLCEVARVGYRFSSYGPQLTAAHAIHIAASSRRLHSACDVAEYQQLRDDPFAGLVCEAPFLVVPEVAGSGVEYLAESTAVEMELHAKS